MSSSVLDDEAIKKLRGTLGSILSSGLTPGEINPLTLKKIYCSVVIPKACFGAQQWSNCSKADLKGLEKVHMKSLKQIATLSPYCNTIFTLVLLDMDSAEDLMDFYKLQFLWQLCRLSPNLLAKQDFVKRLIRHNTVLISSPLMTQCRQVALFSTQVENGMFVNAHLLTTLHKLMYQNQQFFQHFVVWIYMNNQC